MNIFRHTKDAVGHSATIGWMSNRSYLLHKEAHKGSIPSPEEPLLPGLACPFPKPTYQRWLILVLAAILTTGRLRIMNLLRTCVNRQAPLALLSQL